MTRRRFDRALHLRLAPLCGALAVAACGSAGGVLSNLGFEISCGEQSACGWTTVAGAPRFGSTWNPGDPGLDLSGEGTMAVEQRTAFDAQTVRDYQFTAAVLRESGVALRFELSWYASATSGMRETFWTRSPFLVRTDPYPVTSEGLTRFKQLTSIPVEAGGLVLRIVREGSGRCWVDEITYRATARDPNDF